MKSVVVNIPDSVDLSKVNDIKLCIRYCKDNDEYFYVTDGFSIQEERPQGNWIKWNFKTFGPMGDWEYKCDRCEKVYGGEYNFCPNCGAYMLKGAKNAGIQ